MLKEFKPTLFFLLRFFLTYAVCSVSYGLYIKKFDQKNPPVIDPITNAVVKQLGTLAGWIGYNVDVEKNAHLKYEDIADEQTFNTLYLNDIQAIAVEEGCNGLSVIILFASFIIAFGGSLKRVLIFIPIGIVFIHISNLFRLILLAVLNVDFDGRYFHFFHKYGFTAIIYLSVFILWYIWVQYLIRPNSGKDYAKTN
jgi:exosortase family protein XrtF